MKTNVPDVYDAILRVTTLQGVEAADALKHAVALTFGRFGGKVHCAFLYALMIYVWSSDASTHTAQVQNLLSTYISMEHAMLATLLVTCKDAYAASVTADTMVAQCDLYDIAKTPGYKRLNYLTNITGFTAHWLFLFDCCAELLHTMRLLVAAPPFLNKQPVASQSCFCTPISRPLQRRRFATSRQSTSRRRERTSRCRRSSQGCRSPMARRCLRCDD